MLPIDFTGDRVVDLTILFGLLTAGVGVIVFVMYLVFARLIRRENPNADPARHPDSRDPR